MREDVEIIELDAAEVRAAIGGLAEVLVDCVEGGASVSFMLPFSRGAAAVFFGRVANAVERGETVLIAALVDERVVGTVQLGVDTPPNQPHRAEVKKLLVHRHARRGGVGTALMQAVEEAARTRRRTLLVLDTAAGDAERLYLRLGWNRAGVIPDYAHMPDGRPCDTTILWKRL